MTGADEALGPQCGPEAALKGRHGPNAAPKSLLSFGEEMEDDKTASSAFGLTENTHRKYRAWCLTNQHV